MMIKISLLSYDVMAIEVEMELLNLLDSSIRAYIHKAPPQPALPRLLVSYEGRYEMPWHCNKISSSLPWHGYRSHRRY